MFCLHIDQNGIIGGAINKEGVCKKCGFDGKISSNLELLNRISAAVEKSSNTSNDVEVAAFDELQSNISDDEFGVDVE